MTWSSPLLILTLSVASGTGLLQQVLAHVRQERGTERRLRGATPSRPFTCCRNVSCIVARMDCMSSNGSGLDLANDEAAGRPSFSPGSEAEQSPALLEVQWKVMKRLDGGGKREALGRWKGPPGTGVKSIGNKLQ